MINNQQLIDLGFEKSGDRFVHNEISYFQIQNLKGTNGYTILCCEPVQQIMTYEQLKQLVVILKGGTVKSNPWIHVDFRLPHRLKNSSSSAICDVTVHSKEGKKGTALGQYKHDVGEWEIIGAENDRELSVSHWKYRPRPAKGGLKANYTCEICNDVSDEPIACTPMANCLNISLEAETAMENYELDVLIPKNRSWLIDALIEKGVSPTDVNNINSDTNIFSLIDELDHIEIILDWEQEHQIALPDDVIDECETIGEIEMALSRMQL